MRTVTLLDDQWAKLRDFLKRDPNVYVGQARKCRRFVEAVLWITWSGVQWHLLPSEYGQWNTVYNRCARWCDASVYCPPSDRAIPSLTFSCWGCVYLFMINFAHLNKSTMH